MRKIHYLIYWIFFFFFFDKKKSDRQVVRFIYLFPPSQTTQLVGYLFPPSIRTQLGLKVLFLNALFITVKQEKFYRVFNHQSQDS